MPAGLCYLMTNSERFRRVMRGITAWDYGMDNFNETRFERLTVDPFHEFHHILEFTSTVTPKEFLNSATAGRWFV